LSGTANFRFASPGDLTITVSLLGAVPRPGRYEVSRSVNLLDLIALGGGFLDYAEEDDVRLTRYVAVGDSQQRRNFRYDLSDLSAVSENDLTLEDGDILVVTGSPRSTFDDALRYVSSIAAIVAAGLAIALSGN
jgi:protein involved in polysaccharide export with SLBB domain